MSETWFRVKEGIFLSFSYIPINQNLEAMAKQLYDYWFVQFDFPNKDGKPYKSSGGETVSYTHLDVYKRQVYKLNILYNYIIK